MPISVFREKRNIKRSRNGTKSTGEVIFGRKHTWWTWTPRQKIRELPTRVGARPLPHGAPVAPLTCFFCLYISTYPKTSRTEHRSGVLPPEAYVATENQSRPVPAPCRRGQSFSGGHLHHPGALHDKEGVVLPRGWGYVPVAMCLISLSLSCSWFGTILIHRELCYYSWIICFSSPSSLL